MSDYAEYLFRTTSDDPLPEGDLPGMFDESNRFLCEAPLRAVRRTHRADPIDSTSRSKYVYSRSRPLSPFEALTGFRFWDHPTIVELDWKGGSRA